MDANDEKWEDITHSFSVAAKGLALHVVSCSHYGGAAGLEQGELVHDDHFTLGQAMQAIELMDLRMDAGW